MNDKGLDLSLLFTFNDKYVGMNNELQGKMKNIPSSRWQTRATRILQRL